jgi:hypothetical protein
MNTAAVVLLGLAAAVAVADTTSVLAGDITIASRILTQRIIAVYLFR